jgi:hypothetical protein
MAIKQFKRLKTRFVANEQLHLEYDNFIKEYLQLKHMEIVGSDELFTSAAYYLPHHPIIKQSSLTTKTRVVFNASFKAGGDELSLNDNLFTGPILQKDIFSLLLKCRIHKILLSADITKMFRQILVHPQNRDYLRIVYRNNPNTSIKTYRLKTVIVFPFIIWFYGSAIVIIRGWGCGFGNRREDIVAYSDNRQRTFFYSSRIYGGSYLLSGYLTP